MIGLTVVSSLGWFAYFARGEPDRLQTEEFQITMSHLHLLRQAGKEPGTIDLKAQTTPNSYVNPGASND